MDSLLCGWASEGVGEAVGRPVDPCWDDEGNDVDAGPQRVEPDEAPTVVVEESDVAALAEEMRKLSEDAIAMKEQMRLLELERLEAHLEAERAARAEDAAAMDEDEPAAPATLAARGRLRALAAAELVDFGDAARYLALAPADDPLAAVVDATRRNTLAAECELLATPGAVDLLERNGRPFSILFERYADADRLAADGLGAFLDDWWLAPALLPRAKVLDVALQMEARDGAPGLGRLQFVELLGHVGLRAMPGDTPKRRLLELVAWLDKSKGRAALGHPHRATLAFAFH
ncbi:hypothetical protein JL722_8115 [Aureococcus anophagefferens]|nr:hypothetical protein JL722_8115 [Aureococcus anophagefferens]